MRCAVLTLLVLTAATVPVGAAPTATCQQMPPDPDGWFALGDPLLPTATDDMAAQSIKLGFDESGRPFAALSVPGMGLIAATATDAGLRIAPLGIADPLDMAVGADARGALIAVVLSSGKTVILHRDGEKWLPREVGLFCRGSNWNPEFGLMTEWPAVTIDGAGRVFQACIQRTYAAERVRIMPSLPPLRSVRLRLGRLDGNRWVETALALPQEFARTPVLLTTNKSGEPVAWLSSGTENGEVAVPRGDGRDHGAAPRLVRTPGSDGVLAVAGAGWFRFKRSCEAEPAHCVLEGAEPLELPAIPHALAHRSGTWIAAVLAPFRLVIGDGKSWRPLYGPAAPGISAAGSRASSPAIALTRCGQPVVLWREGTEQMKGRAWNGSMWSALPPVVGAGPHGLVVGPSGDALVGSWTLGERPSLSVRRIGSGAAAAELPPLLLPVDEWRTIDVERTRLTLDDALHAAFPIHDHALAAPHRIGFRFDQQKWQSEPVPASLVAAPAMPWGDRPEIAKRSALAIDDKGRQIVVWADGSELAVARWEGPAWRPLPRIAAGGVSGVPAIAASSGRVCLAWAGPQGLGTEIFVRCHRGAP